MRASALVITAAAATAAAAASAFKLDQATDWLVHPYTAPCTFAQNPDGSWTLSNGLVSRTFVTSPGFGTVDLYSHVRGVSLLRAIESEGYLSLDGVVYPLGGIAQTGTYYHAYLNRSATGIERNAGGWDMKPGTTFVTGAPVAPFPWTPGTRGSPKTASWPPRGLQVSVELAPPASARPAHQAVSAWLVYEIYEGVPLMAKWLVVNSTGPASAGVVITGAVPESLRLSPEYAPLSIAAYPPSVVQVDNTALLYVGTDQAHSTAVQWVADSALPADPGATEPLLQTNYTDNGPGVVLSGGLRGAHNGFRPPLVHPTLALAAPSAEFVSFRTFELVTDTTDAERFGLAVRRLTRLWAPHVQENPIFFHYAGGLDNASWTQAVDQAAATGFEMIIFSFGTPFNMETTDPTYLAQIHALVAYAASKGIEVGGYDLICLDRGNGGYGGNVGDQWDTVLPGGSLGQDACFASGWVDKLDGFVAAFTGPSVGLSMLETDGPYGGEGCASTNHSHHVGASDSVYQQTRVQAAFYADLRARNIYINQPDNYFFQGGSKTGMGYNEDQFSLPRWQDVTVSRMTVYDQTYRKIPSQGWMFVPLIDYHGGGADAAFEPMSVHLPEYNMALAQYLGAGVAACYRGTRLFDTPQVEAVVSGWVAVYKKYRDIITSDLIHLRRPDGQGIDGWLHANAALAPDAVGWAIFFNPTGAPLSQVLDVPLYYTGISTTALVSQEDGPAVALPLARDYSVALNVTIPAQGATWFVIRSGDKQ